MIEAIIKKVEKLPPVPNVIHELQDMFYLDSYNAADIESVIKKDPNLMANILKIANSPLYGFTREIVDIRQAIVLFGLEQIIEFALAGYIDTMIDLDLEMYGIDEMEFLKMAQNKAKVASALIEEKKERFIVSNTAFLSDVSKVLLAQYAKERHIPFKVQKDIALNDLDAIEQERLGTDSIAVAVLMFDAWNFGNKMIALLQSFKERQKESQEALFLAREIVSLDGNILTKRGEGSPLASRLPRL